MFRDESPANAAANDRTGETVARNGGLGSVVRADRQRIFQSAEYDLAIFLKRAPGTRREFQGEVYQYRISKLFYNVWVNTPSKLVHGNRVALTAVLL